MGNGQTGTRPVNRQTDTSENITFSELRWRAVKMDSGDSRDSTGSTDELLPVVAGK